MDGRKNDVLSLNDALQVVSFAADLMDRKASSLATGSPKDLVKHFDDVRKAYKAIGDVKKLINAVEDRLSRELIPDMFKREGVKTINFDGIGRTTVSYRYGCSMIDKPRGIEWLRANGAEGLVQETVNAQTLAAYSKELLETQGKELPDDIFKVSTSPFTSITKT